MWIFIETESDIEIFQMYGIDGAGPAPSLLYQVLPCLVILMLITLLCYIAFLQIKLGTLVHHITLMTKR